MSRRWGCWETWGEAEAEEFRAGSEGGQVDRQGKGKRRSSGYLEPLLAPLLLGLERTDCSEGLEVPRGLARSGAGTSAGIRTGWVRECRVRSGTRVRGWSWSQVWDRGWGQA